MPNHFTTKVTMRGKPEVIAAFYAKHITKGEGGDVHFDFNTVIPMPGSIRGTVSSSGVSNALIAMGRDDVLAASSFHTTIASMLEYPWVKVEGVVTEDQLRDFLAQKVSVDDLKAAHKSITAFEETGFADWYVWATQNWGTKWNSYSFNKHSPNCFSFDSAWGPPILVLEKLVSMWPDITFKFVGHDEGERKFVTLT